ncbi:hypothetical protein MUK70_11655 [Dyadobacter chenwenxiniae]|uniref:Uncharacterized protein n=1 Tax=Dyadobacter chenwenxiniae TaxID=2906456 RepID=A0A9X1PET6_9BACT|nr:hypothetical protein [Dyadobacter chenwenxiniae]MCF0059895.1 hypothetical protein [Dyadobacter chenwenxiniae]UON85635.1 hypothetical protein MUK70_11655 [Dyadobacter chenwenxiniae]
MKTAEEYLVEAEAKASHRFESLSENDMGDVAENIKAYKSFVVEAMKDYAKDCITQTLINAAERIKQSKEVNMFTKALIRKTPPVLP